MDELHQIRLFGGLTIVRDGAVVTPTASKQAQLIALLLLRMGDHMGRELFAEELWGGHPPRTYQAAIHTYVMQLRRRISDGGPNDVYRIDRTESRYAFHAEVSTDLQRYLTMAGLARSRQQAKDVDGFIDHALDALATWSSDLLADVVHGPVLRRYVHDLEMQHRALRRDLATALVSVGRLNEGMALISSTSPEEVEQSSDVRPLKFYCLALLGRRAEALRLYAEISPQLKQSKTFRWIENLHADIIRPDGTYKPYNSYIAEIALPTERVTSGS